MKMSQEKLALIKEWAANPYGNSGHVHRGGFPDWLGFVRDLLGHISWLEQYIVDSKQVVEEKPKKIRDGSAPCTKCKTNRTNHKTGTCQPCRKS